MRMANERLYGRDFSNELVFNASRSSGPGGQNVNKVNSKIELRFNVEASTLLTEDEKKQILEKLTAKITDSGDLVIVSQKDRSQIRNKELAQEKFYNLLHKALTPAKVRKPTSLTRASREKRLEEKRMLSLKKESRKSSGFQD